MAAALCSPYVTPTSTGPRGRSSPSQIWAQRDGARRTKLQTGKVDQVPQWRSQASPPRIIEDEGRKAGRQKRRETIISLYGSKNMPPERRLQDLYKLFKRENNAFNTWLVETVHEPGTALPHGICWAVEESYQNQNRNHSQCKLLTTPRGPSLGLDIRRPGRHARMRINRIALQRTISKSSRRYSIDLG